MCWICDPIGETSKTLAHVGEVIATDQVAKVATIAAVAAGAGLWGTTEAATTAAEIGATSAASGAAALTPLEPVTLNSWGPVAAVTAGSPAASSFSLSAVADGAVSALGSAGKVMGGLNALGLVSQRPAGADRFGGAVKSVVPVYGGMVPSAGGTAETGKASGGAAAAAVPGRQAVSGESSLTLIASALTILALVTQFAKGN